MATFNNLYTIDKLEGLTGVQLMHRLFDNAAMSANGNQGLLSWLEFANGRVNTYFGRLGNFNQDGIKCTQKGCINYNRGASISNAEAVNCAKEVLDVLKSIDAAIKAKSFSSEADYTALNIEITNICSKHTSYSLWRATGEPFHYIIKYFHILYPEIISGFYTDSQLTAAETLLGMASAGLSLIERNGLITLKMKALIPNANGYKFAKALYSVMY